MSAAESFSIFRSATDSFVDLVGRIDPAALTGPGLGEWDLRALIGHTSRSLITVVSYAEQPAGEIAAARASDYYRLIAEAFTDSGAVAERGRQAGEALGTDPVATVIDLAGQARATLARHDPGYLLTTLVGGMPLGEYLRTRIFELVVHGLDISRATGLEIELPPAALGDAVGLAAETAAVLGHGRTALLALTGREPLPPGFSVV